MCTSVYRRIKHRLGTWERSSKTLRMANGTKVVSEAVWHGRIELGDVGVEGSFEVFDSGGGWAFLFGKPLLKAFNAIHDYGTDSVEVRGSDNHTATFSNQLRAPLYRRMHETRGINLLLDWKQHNEFAGGDNPPSRRVSHLISHFENSTNHEQPCSVDDEPLWAHIDEVDEEEAPREGIAAADNDRWRVTLEEIEDEDAPKRRQINEWEERIKRAQDTGLGSASSLPAREVPPHLDHFMTRTPVDIEPPLAPNGDPIWDVNALLEGNVFTRHTDPFLPDRVARILEEVTIGESLSPAEREQVHALLMEFADCFALSMGEVKHADEAVHKLNIPEGTKFNTKPRQRPLTPPQCQYLNQKVDEMLEAGIIVQVHPSQVKAVSPTTLAQKAHEGTGLTLDELQHRVNDECSNAGMAPAFDLPPRPAEASPAYKPETPQKWRICQNFNEVNKITEVAPMPQGDIRAKQRRLSGHRYLSVFDFAARFHALEIDEESRPYTAFYVEGRGYFWYIRMPFGLTGAPASFAYMMGRHLYDLLVDDVMELFVDDGGAFADEFDGMMGKLRRIFTRVRERNLSLSASKSSFFMTEAVFTGARVGPQGVLPDLTKLTAIVDWPQPADALNLMSFLGLTGHFRDLIRNYTKVERSLRDLLQGANLPTPCSKSMYRRILQDYKLSSHWTDTHTRAFIGLKAALTSEPVLRGPQWDGTPFIVTTDGCQDGFAGVLSQRTKTTLPSGKTVEKLHPIAFASKRTSSSEEKYKPFLLEFAALKFALDKFSDVIWGFPVIVETDCQALRDVLLSDGLNSIHARWRDGILAYQIIDVKHVPGRLNVVADGLSRKAEGLPHTEADGSEWTVNEDWESSQGLVCDVLALTDAAELHEPEMRERFKAEPFFVQIIDAILGQDQGTSVRDKKRARHRASEARVECLTREEAQAKAYEQHVEGGHWGRDHVKLNIMDRIWCPGLDTCILRAIRECPQCKNFGARHIHSLLEPITRRHPFELLVGDYLSMPPGKGGFKTLGVYLDTFSQHIWVFMYKKPGSAASTIDSLERIFKTYTPPEDFMSDGGSHFHCAEVRTCCAKWNVKPHVVASYSPWVNGLVEGTNKILLHVLARLTAPGLGEEEYNEIRWEKLHKSWPEHLENAVRMLNGRLLPALKFSPRELLFGQVVNTIPSSIEESTSILHAPDAATHMAYVVQQRLDGYEAIVQHATRQTTLKAAKKLLARWSHPHRITERLLNSYSIEQLDGTPVAGTTHARRLRAFIPKPGSDLEREQHTFMEHLEQENPGGLAAEEAQALEEQDDRASDGDRKKTAVTRNTPRDAQGRFTTVENAKLSSASSPLHLPSDGSIDSPAAGTPASFGSESGADSWNASGFSSAIASRPPTRAREHLLFGHHPYGTISLNDSTDRLSDAHTAESTDGLSGIEFVLPTFDDAEPVVPKVEPKPEPDLVPPARATTETPHIPARTQQHAPKPDPDSALRPCKLPFPVLTTKPQTQQSLLPPPVLPTATALQPLAMATAQPVAGFHYFFRGNDDDENTPGNFLRLYLRYMESLGKSPSPDWVTGFKNYLYEDSPAEDWYKALLPAALTDWTAFEAAFRARWKLAKKAVKSSAELQQEMLEYRLREELLGTKVTVGGREVWTHVQWAKHMLELAERADIATSTQNIWLIRRELPDIIKDFVPETHADWTAFAQAVTDIDISRLRDKVDAKRRRDGELARMNTEVQRLATQLQRLNTQQP
ncbi:hypothetical protein EWM64_g9142, partial [Hericium alpestre]